jgi:GT2 family glycosyltransferase
VVSFNSARHIERLLDSVPAAAEGLRIHCIVVDNDSSDETMSILRSRSDITIIEAGQNLGYAGAINLGRKLVGCDCPLLILNPDLVLKAGAITHLYQALDDPAVGVVLPMLLDSDGSLYLSLRREPSPARAFGDALFGSRLPGRPGWLSDTVRSGRPYRVLHDVEWGSGAAMLISAACNDAVGDWDDMRFFLYSEETDFAARARLHGYRVRYVPGARIWHEGGGSGQSPELAALMAVNRVRYYEKYNRRPSTSLFRAAVALHYLIRFADPQHRAALKAVLRRSAWAGLLGGRTVPRIQPRLAPYSPWWVGPGPAEDDEASLGFPSSHLKLRTVIRTVTTVSFKALTRVTLRSRKRAGPRAEQSEVSETWTV